LKNKISASSDESLGKQVENLTQVVERMRSSYSDGRDIPEDLLDGLEHLSIRLKFLSNKVKSLDEQRQQWASLASIGNVINSSLELSEVLCVVMDAIVSLTGAERGVLMLRADGPSTGELVPQIARNWEQESIEESDLALSRTIIKRVYEDGQPILTTNAQQDPRFDTQQSIIVHNLRAILCVPLKVKGETTGVIYVDNRIRSGVFTSEKLGLLSAFANQAAVAIDNARMYESVRKSLREVREIKRLMDNVFASMASGVITTDLDEQITLCNRASEQILGVSSQEIIGKNLSEVLPTFIDELSEHLPSVRIKEKQRVGLEMTRPCPQRGTVTLSFNLTPLQENKDQLQGVAIVFDDLTEKKRLEGQQRLFGRMVPPQVIEQLDPDQLKLGGLRTEITALFADVEGFTSFSETVPPERLMSILNQYLSVAVNAVMDQYGTIDKFMGDAIMAWFNAPVPQPDHTLRATRAALKIQQAVLELHRHLPPEFRLFYRIGIHTGEAVLGLVGTEARVNYTAIGDVVNTAKRIQESAGTGQILISRQAFEKVANQVQVRPLKPLILKGKRQPVEVHELLGLRLSDDGAKTVG
jgi:adenylate cyclase